MQNQNNAGEQINGWPTDIANRKACLQPEKTRGLQIPCNFKLKIFIFRLRNYKIRNPRQILRQITGLTFLLFQSRKFPLRDLIRGQLRGHVIIFSISSFLPKAKK